MPLVDLLLQNILPCRTQDDLAPTPVPSRPEETVHPLAELTGTDFREVGSDELSRNAFERFLAEIKSKTAVVVLHREIKKVTVCFQGRLRKAALPQETIDQAYPESSVIQQSAIPIPNDALQFLSHDRLTTEGATVAGPQGLEP
jgi:hypothetical protein